MFEQEWNREQRAGRKADRQSALLIVAILLSFTLVDSLSTLTEFAREGEYINPAAPWLLNLTSVSILTALIPVMLWTASRAPVTAETWRWSLPVHLGVSLVLSLIHVAAMVAIRKLLWPVLFGEPYTFFNSLFGDFFYEYRKDIFAYAGFILIIQSSREYQQQRLETAAAREDARRDKRLTLKCGGRTIWMAAGELITAKAAGNYVEVKTETGEHLARTTLAALERQLDEAGIRAARVHRSYLINLDKILEAAPTSSGDLSIRMKDGSEIPGSRRFRDKLHAA